MMILRKRTTFLVSLMIILAGLLPAAFAEEAAPLTAAEKEMATRINNTFRRAAQQVMPAVVFIHILDAGRPVGLGSGVIIDPAGWVCTNNHVVSDDGEIEILLSDGRRFSAEEVFTDPDTDLAVVRIDPQGEPLPSARFGDSGQLQVGDFVMAIGSPFGLEQTVTVGVVSFLGRQTRILDTRWGYEDFIQTDAVINRGNSGGPLANLYGEVVGINSNILSPTGVSAGYGFAIPSELAKFVTKQLISHGEVRRGYLGVNMHPMTLFELRNYPPERLDRPEDREVIEFARHLPADLTGVLIVEVQPDTPAEAAGLERFDVVTHVNDRAMADSSQLRNLIGTMPPDTETRFTIWRDGATVEKTVKLADRSVAREQDLARRQEEQRRMFGFPAPRPRLGVNVRMFERSDARALGMAPDTVGALIIDVVPDTLADRFNLRPGEVITEVGGKAVTSIDRLRELISEADLAAGVELRLVTPDGIRTVTLSSESD